MTRDAMGGGAEQQRGGKEAEEALDASPRINASAALGRSAPRLTSLHKTDEDERPLTNLSIRLRGLTSLAIKLTKMGQDGHQTDELVNSDACILPLI